VDLSAAGNPIVTADVPLPIEPFEARLPQVQSTPSSALSGFVPTTYPDPAHQELFSSAQSQLSHLPRHGLINGSIIPGQAQFSQLGSHDMSANGFSIGAPWVWG